MKVAGCSWLLAAVAGLAATAPAAGQGVYAVDRDQVNVRADATTQSDRVGILTRGEQVVELRRHGQWLQVELAGQQAGWIHAQLLQQRYVVEGQGVRLREGPSTQHTSVTMMFRGQEVGRIGQRGNWTQVRTEDGREGWLSSRFLRAKSGDDLQAERPVAATPRAAPEPEPADDDTSPGLQADELAILERNPYAEGLRHEAGGEHAEALASFEEVLAQDPAHVNALVHAAQAHRHMGQYDEALEKLYAALQTTGGRKDVYLILGEVYRLRAEPDSAARYQDLFRGRTPQQPATAGADVETVDAVEPVERVERVEPVGDVVDDARPLPEARTPAAPEASSWIDSPWSLLGVAGIGLLALAGIAWWVVNSSTEARGTGQGPAGRFTRVWKQEEAEVTEGRATPEEERELDHQIDAKWRELRASVEAFRPGAPSSEGDGVADVLDQVDGLRRTLEGQDERARLYADIVRLQNMKIDAMTEEIRRLRSRGKA